MSYNLLGSSSSTVNGQLVPRTRVGNYYPRALSPTGPGGTGVPATPVQTAGPSGSGPASSSANSTAAAATAGANPWSPVKSPVPWLIAFFLVGVLLLRFVHHGY